VISGSGSGTTTAVTVVTLAEVVLEAVTLDKVEFAVCVEFPAVELAAVTLEADSKELLVVIFELLLLAEAVLLAALA